MSKKTRHADNSKRQQPIQQQRAQAAMRQASSAKQAKGTDKESNTQAHPEPAGRKQAR